MADVLTDFRIVFFNVRGARFSSKSSWAKRRGDVLKRLNRVLTDVDNNKASVYVLAECRADEVAYLKSKMAGYGVVAHETSGIAIFYQKVVWDYTPGRYWTQVYNAYTHGALVTELVHKTSGQPVNIGGAHLVPFSWRHKERRAALKRLLGLVDGWEDPTILALDSNWTDSKYAELTSIAKTHGFHSHRDSAAVKIRSGYQSTGAFKVGRKPIDVMYGSKGTSSKGFRTLKGWGSDHHMITDQVRIATTRSNTT